ncbi:MAG: hypothetical protein R3E57_06260 [Porticoccaceae bacterium]
MSASKRSRLLAFVALVTTVLINPAHANDKPCIAIAPPKAQLGQGASGQDVSGPVQNMLISYLSGPMLEVVTLQSRLPAQLDAEAKQSGCQYMLSTDVEYEKKKSWGKALSIGAGVISSALPYAGVGGSMGSFVAATTAANVANTAANVQMQQESMEKLTAAQGTIRKGDSISLDYALKNISGGNNVIANNFKTKAEQDGQDLLIPMIEQTATEVFNKVTQ